MFDLMPFEHRGRNLFNFFDDFEKNFFGDLSTDFAQFRTDILDKGDHYLLQAELPGFHKEDINIDLSDNALTIRAEHNEQNDEKDDKGNYKMCIRDSSIINQNTPKDNRTNCLIYTKKLLFSQNKIGVEFLFGLCYSKITSGILTKLHRMSFLYFNHSLYPPWNGTIPWVHAHFLGVIA